MYYIFVVHYAFFVLLLVGVLTALVVAIASLLATFWRWKSPDRRSHVVRLSISLAAIPILIATEYIVQRFVLLPARGRQHTAELNKRREEKLAETSLVRIGDQAPQFSLTIVDGDEFSFPSDGKVTLINFFATWCGPCIVELPHIEQIWKAHQKNDRFRMMVIGREETTESVREFREKNGFTFPIAADVDQRVFSLFAKGTIPRTLVVAPDGRIVYSKVGFIESDLDELEHAIVEQLKSSR